jgi:hypothetical protein
VEPAADAAATTDVAPLDRSISRGCRCGGEHAPAGNRGAPKEAPAGHVGGNDWSRGIGAGLNAHVRMLGPALVSTK